MNDQRNEAYIDLSKQFLNCLPGQETELFLENPNYVELIDTELLFSIIKLAAEKEVEGDQDSTLQLKNLAKSIAESLGIPIEANSTNHELSRDSFIFYWGLLNELIVKIIRCAGDTKEIHRILYSYLESLNDDLLATLHMFERPVFYQGFFFWDQENKSKIALGLSLLGYAIQNLPFGNQALNIYLASAIYNLALQVLNREDFPDEWTFTQHYRAKAFLNNVYGNHAFNIDLAIASYQLALQVWTREKYPSLWSEVQSELGNAYAIRILGEKKYNIEQALNAYQLTLQVWTREKYPSQWAKIQSLLAGIYLDCMHGNRAENVEKAIIAFELALEVINSQNFPGQWAATQTFLAHGYIRRGRGEKAKNIEKAISACNLALQVITRKELPEDWASTQNILGNAYLERIQGNQRDNIEQAIAAYELALQVRTKQKFPVKWATTKTNLAVAYNSRICGDKAENIERAITSCQQVLQVSKRENDPFNWALTQQTLANAYARRIRGDRVENIEEAISTYNLALTIYTKQDSPLEWASVQNNLAATYNLRIRGNRIENIEEAISTYNLALQVLTKQDFPLDWARTHNNLAVAYLENTRNKSGKNIESEIISKNIEQAINACEFALQIFTLEKTPYDWARTHNNLSGAYGKRLDGEKSDNAEKQIACLQLALQVFTRDAFPLDWAKTQLNLAIALINRTCGKRAENFRKAITAGYHALEIFRPEQFPSLCRRTAMVLGDILTIENKYEEALSPYQIALQATERLYQESLFRSSQEVELAEARDLYHRTAFGLAQAGDLTGAVVTLERGRAHGLRDALERDRVDLVQMATVAPDLYETYQTSVEALRQLEADERAVEVSAAQLPASEDDLRQRATTIREQLSATIENIRQVPGYADFLSQPDIEDIATALRPGHPLVYLVTAPNGSLALVFHQESGGQKTTFSVKPVWLDGLTYTTSRELLTGSEDDDLSGWFGAYLNQKTDPDGWFQTIDQVTHQLWDLVMDPVVKQLEVLGFAHAVLIPTGLLSFLPLHAAWTEDAATATGRCYALDRITFTYAPNALSLATSQTTAVRSAGEALLAINEPRPSQANALPHSEQEVQAALTYFPQNQLLHHEQASRDSVLTALPNYDVLHFSCHGTANFFNPLNSGLLMANNETLTLRDFYNLQFPGIRLAILSACETGLPGAELPDEVVSLPTGLLQAGVAGVVASLWSVTDLSTMLLVSKFYKLWREKNLPANQALSQAQIWLRESTESEIAPLLGLRTRTPNKRLFEHPYYWAAFSYTGV